MAVYNTETLLNSIYYFAKIGSKFCQKLNKPSKNCQSGDFSSNLVTLVASRNIVWVWKSLKNGQTSNDQQVRLFFSAWNEVFYYAQLFAYTNGGDKAIRSPAIKTTLCRCDQKLLS